MQSLTLTSGPVRAQLPGASIDVYTQRDGKGPNQPSDAFAPEERVIITAYLTYNGTPVTDKIVTFRMYFPNGTLLLMRTRATNDSGLAFINYLIPSKPVFGLYSTNASASVYGETVSDTLCFRVGWLVEVVEALPCDENGDPKNQFEIGEPLYFRVKLENIRLNSTNATVTLTAFDDYGALIFFHVEEHTISPNQTTIVLNPGTIPQWAHVGIATGYVCAYEWLYGPAYCPEVQAWFLIKPPIPDVAVVGVTASPFEVYFGQLVNITVSVLNEYYLPQSFNVIIYANTSVIQILTITDLPSYTQTNFTFSWNTTISPGNYTISAQASTVPGEIDTTDNNYTDGVVEVLCLSFKLIITSTTGGTTDPPQGTYTYDANSAIQVAATPTTGYLFDHWELDGLWSIINPITVTMNYNRTLHAIFRESTPLPQSVGGIYVPVDKLALLTPYIALTLTIIVATAATAIYVMHVKRRKKKQ